MANPTITYRVLIEYKTLGQMVSKWVNVDILLDQKSKSKAKNRLRAAEEVKKLYPSCVINQITYN